MISSQCFPIFKAFPELWIALFRILEILEAFQRDFKLPDRNFTVTLRNLLLNIRVTTEHEEKHGVYFQPDMQVEASC